MAWGTWGNPARTCRPPIEGRQVTDRLPMRQLTPPFEGVGSDDGNTLELMAAAHPLQHVVGAEAEGPERLNVVRLVDFLGPISPELVLVDPELAPRARALLPELPWNWQPGTREAGQPIALRIVQVSGPAKRSHWRLAAASALAAAAAAAFGLGVSIAAPDGGETARIEPRPPVATPAVSTVSNRPARPKPKPKPKPSSSQARAEGAPPRFVWPGVANAKGYRVAFYREGRQIFERDVTATGFQLSPSWTYRGRFYGLEKGVYRWVVWPLLGAARNQGRAIISARYVV